MSSRFSQIQVSPVIKKDIDFKKFAYKFDLEEHLSEDEIDKIQKLGDAKSKQEMMHNLQLLHSFLEFQINEQMEYIQSIFKKSTLEQNKKQFQNALEFLSNIDEYDSEELREAVIFFKRLLKFLKKKINHKHVDLEGFDDPEGYLFFLEEDFKKRYLLVVGLFEFYLYQMDRYNDLPLKPIPESVFFAAPAA
jgi:hypothetical protein